MHFLDKLHAAIEKNNSLLCIGLDPNESRLADDLTIYEGLISWARAIIETTHDLVCCYKPNIAFFEQFGLEGLEALEAICNELIPAEIPVLLDAKRGDIGSTAEAYARACFNIYGADAVTLSPYLGYDAIKPFTDREDKAVFVLCQTSNPSAAQVQEHGTPALFEHIAKTSQDWGNPGQVGLVVGATKPKALGRVRQLCPEAWILAPGVGAQGGNLRSALVNGLRDDGLGMIVPVSRSVMNADDPHAAAMALRDEINAIRKAFQEEQGLGYIVEALSENETRLIEGLFDTGSVKFGEFTLASGKKSPIYLDLRRLVSFPWLLDLAVEAYAKQLEGLDYDLIAGVPYAALPIASVLASKLKKPMVYPRKEVKTHGTGQLVEGVFKPGQSVVVIEDLITMGGSLKTAAESLQVVGLVADQAVVLIDREQGGMQVLADAGIKVHPALRFSQVLDHLLKAGKIDQAAYDTVKDYLKNG